MVKYEPQVIRQFASKLYRSASLLVILYSVLGFVVGPVAGAGLWSTAGVFFRLQFGMSQDGFVLLSLGLFTLLGFSMGQSRAFTLRLQAQQLLCQVQIEENTRLAGLDSANRIVKEIEAAEGRA